MTNNSDESRPVKHWTGVKRIAGLTVALVAVVLAAVGIFLPLLPSTPFALLAAFLLMRCSPAWHARLLRSKLFGGLLRDWNERGGIRPRDKWKAIVIVIAAGSVSLVLTQPGFVVGAIVVALLTIGIVVVALLPTAR